MVDVVEGTCAADDRRRTPMLRTITTVDNMHSGLLREGVQMSRSAVYLRVIPRRGDTIEGRRHVQTGKFFAINSLKKARKTGRAFHINIPMHWQPK